MFMSEEYLLPDWWTRTNHKITTRFCVYIRDIVPHWWTYEPITRCLPESMFTIETYLLPDWWTYEPISIYFWGLFISSPVQEFISICFILLLWRRCVIRYSLGEFIGPMEGLEEILLLYNNYQVCDLCRCNIFRD